MRALRGMSGIYHISAIVETYNLRGVPQVPIPWKSAVHHMSQPHYEWFGLRITPPKTQNSASP
jgi:hypothetical protein